MVDGDMFLNDMPFIDKPRRTITHRRVTSNRYNPKDTPLFKFLVGTNIRFKTTEAEIITSGDQSEFDDLPEPIPTDVT